MSLIDRDKLLECYDNRGLNIDNYHVPIRVIRQNILDMPAVDAKPVIHAHLIPHHDELFGDDSECSNCHCRGMLYGNYCANCGAKFEEDK